MEYQSNLHKKLHNGEFVFTAETTPPDASSKEVLIEKIKPSHSSFPVSMQIVNTFSQLQRTITPGLTSSGASIKTSLPLSSEKRIIPSDTSPISLTG